MRSYPVLDPVSQAYPEVQGRSPTCYSPVRHSCTPERALPFDLHVLSTPPAFVLSQDQTLQTKLNKCSEKPDKNQNQIWQKQTTPQKTEDGESPSRHGQTKNNKQKPPNTLLSSQTTHPDNQLSRLTGNPATVVRQVRQVKPRPPASDGGAVSFCALLAYALNLRAQTHQVLHKERISPVDVEYVVDLGVAVRDQPREHQARAGADVG
jgi:hypothetical protein